MICPSCGNSDESMIVGHEVRRVYDGVLYWHCVKCGHAWSREWPAGGRRHRVAREMVEKINRGRDE